MTDDLRRRIAQALIAGVCLDAIEDVIIDPAPLDEEEKSALWLYAEALQEDPGVAGRTKRFATMSPG
jgi:hypothetical protein